MVRDYVSKRYPDGYICSKCGMVAPTFFENRGILLDGVYFCDECKPEIEFNWYRHHMNGSDFWLEVNPPLYFTTLGELCASDDASLEDLEFKRRMARLIKSGMAIRVDIYREPKNDLQIAHLGWAFESIEETEVSTYKCAEDCFYGCIRRTIANLPPSIIVECNKDHAPATFNLRTRKKGDGRGYII